MDSILFGAYLDFILMEETARRENKKMFFYHLFYLRNDIQIEIFKSNDVALCWHFKSYKTPSNADIILNLSMSQSSDNLCTKTPIE